MREKWDECYKCNSRNINTIKIEERNYGGLGETRDYTMVVTFKCSNCGEEWCDYFQDRIIRKFSDEEKIAIFDELKEYIQNNFPKKQKYKTTSTTLRQWGKNPLYVPSSEYWARDDRMSRKLIDKLVDLFNIWEDTTKK